MHLHLGKSDASWSSITWVTFMATVNAYLYVTISLQSRNEKRCFLLSYPNACTISKMDMIVVPSESWIGLQTTLCKLLVSYCLIDIHTILEIRLSLLSTMSLSVFFSLLVSVFCLCLCMCLLFLCLSVSICVFV